MKVSPKILSVLSAEFREAKFLICLRFSLCRERAKKFFGNVSFLLNFFKEV